MNFIVSWLLNPKNIIKIVISVIILSLLGYNKVLSYKIEKRDNQIQSLNKEILDLNIHIKQLNLSIDKQNNSIKELNVNFEKNKLELIKKEKELAIKNKTKIQYINKMNNYQSPSNLTEIEASHKVLGDYLQFRKGNK